MVWEGARLYIEPSQENLPDLPVPSINEGFIPVAEAHIHASAHIIEAFKSRKLDIKEKHLLKGFNPEPVTRINGDLSAPLLGKRSAGQLIGRCRNFSQEIGKHLLRNVLRESNFNLMSP